MSDGIILPSERHTGEVQTALATLPYSEAFLRHLLVCIDGCGQEKERGVVLGWRFCAEGQRLQDAAHQREAGAPSGDVVGMRSLSDEERNAYFAKLKKEAEEAQRDV